MLQGERGQHCTDHVLTFSQEIMEIIRKPDGSLKSLLTKFLGEKEKSELIQALNMQEDDVVLLAAGEHKQVVGGISWVAL